MSARGLPPSLRPPVKRGQGRTWSSLNLPLIQMRNLNQMSSWNHRYARFSTTRTVKMMANVVPTSSALGKASTMNTSVRCSIQKPARMSDASAGACCCAPALPRDDGGVLSACGVGNAAARCEMSAPEMSMADSSQMGSVNARRIFLKMKPMMASANVRNPWPVPDTRTFAIVYPANIACGAG